MTTNSLNGDVGVVQSDTPQDKVTDIATAHCNMSDQWIAVDGVS